MIQDTFLLEPTFLQIYKDKQPDWGPLGEFVYLRTYARTKDNGDLECWWETVQRVVQGVYQTQFEHCQREGLPWSWSKAQYSAKIMYELIFEMKFLPPGRGLWMMGTDYVKTRGGACLNNCAFVSTKDINVEFSHPFTFTMDMLMVGVGVGFDTRGAGKVKLHKPQYTNIPFVVEDTREGWVALIEQCLDSFVSSTPFPKYVDTTQVRAQGLPITGFGGVASGPEPLQRLVKDIEAILTPKSNGDKITSTQIVDIANAIGKCVIAGNVRRSAEIALGSPDDETFMKLKNWDNIEDPYGLSEQGSGPKTWRWSSNNSIVAESGMDYSRYVTSIEQNGEPGFFWVQNARDYGRMGRKPDFVDSDVDGSNPCGEMSLSSFEQCNLCETFPSRHDSYKDYERTLKYAYLYAKTVSLIRTHRSRTNSVMLKNRRIGMSQTGIVPTIAKIGLQEYLEWCDDGFHYLRKLDQIYSDWLCVPRSKKITCVKPSGTVSLLPGVPPGLHHPYSEYYIRRVRVASTSPFVDIMKQRGYSVEKDVVSSNTEVIAFPVKESDYKRSRAEVSIWEQVALAVKLQKHWADNMVSITVTFKPEEVKEIAKVLQFFDTELKSISFLPLKDHGYAQAPYEAITAEQYNSMVANIKKDDLSLAIHEVTERFCDGDSCTL